MAEMEKRLGQQVIDYEKHGEELRTLQKDLYKHVEKLTKRQDEFVDRITGNQVSEVLMGSVQAVGKEISNKQSEDFTRVITNMNKLQRELKTYNQIFRQELNQQTPWMALKTLVATLITLVKSSVTYVFELVRKLFD